MEYAPGDIVTMKKPHPCGCAEWKLLRVGMDVRFCCCGCGHQILLPRREADRNIRSVRKSEG